MAAYLVDLETTESIARRYNVTPRAVSQFLRRHGAELRPPRWSTVRARIADDVVDAYRRGASTDQIAQLLGTSQTAVLEALRARGEPLRPPGTGRPRESFECLLTHAFLHDRYVRRGMTMIAIAAEAGCSTTTVAAWLQRRQIPARARKRTAPPTLSDRSQLEALLQRHGSVREVAKQLGYTDSAIRLWIRKHGIQFRERPKPDRARAQQLYEGGMSVPEIAEALGRSRSTVNRWLHAIGVTRRRHSR